MEEDKVIDTQETVVEEDSTSEDIIDVYNISDEELEKKISGQPEEEQAEEEPAEEEPQPEQVEGVVVGKEAEDNAENQEQNQDHEPEKETDMVLFSISRNTLNKV